MLKKYWRVLLFAGIMLFVVTIKVALAQSGEPTPPADTSNLPDVLTFLTTGGAAFVAAMFISWLAERIPGWKDVSGNTKYFSQIGLSLVLGGGASYLLTQPALVEQLQPIFRVIVLTLGAPVANQLFHAGEKVLSKKLT